MTIARILHIVLLSLLLLVPAKAKRNSIPFIFVEYNCENFFDCRHDTLKQDKEFLPDGDHHWTFSRYWKKANDISRAIQQCGEWPQALDDGLWHPYHLPDVVTLCEVENDSTMLMLTRRAALKGASYSYIMTDSPDRRGVDVALLYNPLTFKVLTHNAIRIDTGNDGRPTRDVLYVCGTTRNKDTLHIFSLHAPSRTNGKQASEQRRLLVAEAVNAVVDSILSSSPHAAIIIAGDFNDYSQDKSIRMMCHSGLQEVSEQVKGINYEQTGASGTYKYQGKWDSLDHIILSPTLLRCTTHCYILDNPHLLEDDKTYGGKKPFRSFLGPQYHGGVSDHLPMVLRMELKTH